MEEDSDVLDGCLAEAFRMMDPFKPVQQDGGILLMITDLQDRLTAASNTRQIGEGDDDDDDADTCPIAQSEPLIAVELSLPDLRQLRKTGQEIELRMLRARPFGQSFDEDRVETEQVETHRLHQAWPRFLNLEINGRQVFTVKPPKRTQKRRDVPQPISANLKPGENEMKIRINDECPDDFVLAVVQCSPLAPRELAKFAKRISYEQSFRRVQSLLLERPRGEAEGSDGITCVGDEKLQLRCPITLVRPALPSRGEACRHFQCFDLEAYLVANFRTRAFNNRWRCPLCHLELRPGDLRVDAFVESVLKETQDVDEEVWLANDGSWRKSDPPDQIPEDEDSSDDAAAAAAIAAATAASAQKSAPSMNKGPCVIDEEEVALEDREEEERISRRMRLQGGTKVSPLVYAVASKPNKPTRKRRKSEEREDGDFRAPKYRRRRHEDARPDGVQDLRNSSHRHRGNDRRRGRLETQRLGVGADCAEGGQTNNIENEGSNRRRHGEDDGKLDLEPQRKKRRSTGHLETHVRSGRGRGMATGRAKGAAGQVKSAKVGAAPKQAVVRIARIRRLRNVPAPKGAIDLDSDAPPEEVSDDDIPPIEDGPPKERDCNGSLDIPSIEPDPNGLVDSGDAASGRVEQYAQSLAAGLEPGGLIW